MAEATMNEELEKQLKEASDGAMAQLFVLMGKISMMPENPTSTLLVKRVIVSLNKLELELYRLYKKATRQEDTSELGRVIVDEIAETENEHRNS